MAKPQGTDTQDNRRTIPVMSKIPEKLKEELVAVHKKTHFSVSSVIYYLMVRGLKAFKEDGLLFEGENELAFLTQGRKK